MKACTLPLLAGDTYPAGLSVNLHTAPVGSRTDPLPQGGGAELAAALFSCHECVQQTLALSLLNVCGRYLPRPVRACNLHTALVGPLATAALLGPKDVEALTQPFRIRLTVWPPNLCAGGRW